VIGQKLDQHTNLTITSVNGSITVNQGMSGNCTATLKALNGTGEGFAVDASLIKADVNRQRSVPGSQGLPPEAANHAVREYLAVLDDTAFGAATPVVLKVISSADPASRWTAANGGLGFFAYSTNYLIDLKHAVIMDVEASTAVRQAEANAARTISATVKRLSAARRVGCGRRLPLEIELHARSNRRRWRSPSRSPLHSSFSVTLSHIRCKNSRVRCRFKYSVAKYQKR
jgi:hypothetical protein